MTTRKALISTDQLLELAAERRALGHEHILLMVRRKGGNSPKNWDRAVVGRGRPTLYGRCIGAGRFLGEWVHDVLLADFETWVKGEPLIPNSGLFLADPILESGITAAEVKAS